MAVVTMVVMVAVVVVVTVAVMGEDGAGSDAGMTAMRISRSTTICFPCRVTGGELFEDIVAREYYSEADARCVQCSAPCSPLLTSSSVLSEPHPCTSCNPHLSHVIPMAPQRSTEQKC